MARRKRTSTAADLYRRTFENLPIGVKVWHLENPDDPGSLRLVASNRAAAEATGVPLERVLGKTMAEAFPPAVTAGIAEAFADVVRTGKVKDLGELTYGDARVREGVFTVFAFPLPGDCVGVAFKNITQQKLVEMARERDRAIERLLCDIVASANESRTANEAFQRCLDHICAFTRWPVGHVYRREPGSGAVLVSAKLWHLRDPDRFRRFREVSEATTFQRGVGLPGRVWASREPEWIIDITLDDAFPRNREQGEMGVKAAFGFPVPVEREVEAVLEFFSTESRLPDQELLEIMPAVGRHLGRVVERSRSRNALENK